MGLSALQEVEHSCSWGATLQRPPPPVAVQFGTQLHATAEVRRSSQSSSSDPLRFKQLGTGMCCETFWGPVF